MTQLEAIEAKQAARMMDFADFGIKAERGAYAGSIRLSAGEADKVLKLLRRLRRVERKETAR